MASTCWLLVLMLWPLPWLQMVKSGYVYQQFKGSRIVGTEVVIPKDGVYLVSVIGDPCTGCVLTFAVYCLRRGQKMYIVQASCLGIVSHAEAAVGLKRSDRLYLDKNRYSQKAEDASSLSIVYVAGPNSFYITAATERVSSRSVVEYGSLYRLSAWKRLTYGKTEKTFNILTTGLYWVTANIRPYFMSVTMTVRCGQKDLFHVYAYNSKTVSASGAFRLTEGSTIFMVTQGAGTYETFSLLSAVYLAGNTKRNTYPFEHLAFTANFREPRQTVVAKRVIKFGNVLTNYGYMYVDGYTEIRRTGSYMVSIRPKPLYNQLLMPTLYVNGKAYWIFYCEEGIPGGATIAIKLQTGSYLSVKAYTFAELGRDTMFSIAFIQP